MLYGSGDYDGPARDAASPIPRMRPEAKNIALKHTGSGMFGCLNQPPPAVFARKNTTEKMDGGPMRHYGIKGPILTDPIYNGGNYSNRSTRPVPRVKPEAEAVAEKSKGSMSIVLGEYGKNNPAASNIMSDENMNPEQGPMRKVGIRSPILVDPVYKDNYTGRTPRPAARVKPEAEEIANKSKGVIARIIAEEQPRYFDKPKPKKVEKNHTAANVKRMREIQRSAKEKEANKPKNTPVKALWKSSQYNEVESKVKGHMQTAPPPAPRSDRPNSAPARSSSVGDNNSARKSISTPKNSQLPPSRAKKPINFVAKNARAAKSHDLGRSKSQLAMTASDQKYQDGLRSYHENIKGKTPNYLQQRQKRWAAEERERIRNQPDPTVPEGHTVLPDKERRETLSTLQTSQHELLMQYRTLPMRSYDSLGVMTRKNELERRILEVDEAIKIFERPRVFVKIDS